MPGRPEAEGLHVETQDLLTAPIYAPALKLCMCPWRLVIWKYKILVLLLAADYLAKGSST